ncbi:unnamed protein product [Closterium sp. NIES-64]|nr:unnamed protein product [Closterium sp. NIES-64]
MWVTLHPPQPASPRPVNIEDGVDVGVNAGGDQVGSSVGSTSRQRGVIHADKVGVIQAQGVRPTAVAGSSHGNVGGRRSGLSPMSATQVTVGRIALSYGYFKFTSDRILCCSPGVQIALKWCREYLDAVHRPWHLIEPTYQVTDNLFIAQLEGQLTHLRMGDEETATDYCNQARQILATIRMARALYSTASDCDDDDAKGGRGRFGSRRPHRGQNKSRKETQSTKSTSGKDADSPAGSKARDDKTASCSLAGVVEPTVSLAPKAGEDFQAVVAAVQANPAVVLLDSGCSHHLMGTKEVFVNLQPNGPIKHVRRFNGALQDVQGHGTVALQGEAGKQVLILDVLYVPGVRANLLSSGQLKEHGINLQEDGDRMLLVSAARGVLDRATYSRRLLCTDMRPCSTRSASPTPSSMRAIVSSTKSTPDRVHARLAHVGVDTIWSSAKNEVAIGLDLKSAIGADLPCVSCVGEKLARYTFPD